MEMTVRMPANYNLMTLTLLSSFRVVFPWSLADWPCLTGSTS